LCLDLAGDLRSGPVVGLLTLPPRTFAVKVTLQLPPFVVIGGVSDISFQLLLLGALLDGLGGDGRTAVV
jgi:hypothetical protein